MIGVRLTNGHVIRSKMMISNATPDLTFFYFTDCCNLTQRLREQDQGHRLHIVARIKFALKELHNFLADPYVNPLIPAPYRSCTIHIKCEEMDILEKAFQKVCRGILSEFC